eukprot:SM000015S01159  [mRNA]  locus=s15:167592:170555:+ [translate_table: standard]
MALQPAGAVRQAIAKTASMLLDRPGSVSQAAFKSQLAAALAADGVDASGMQDILDGLNVEELSDPSSTISDSWLRHIDEVSQRASDSNSVSSGGRSLTPLVPPAAFGPRPGNKGVRVIDEFNRWIGKPDLAVAVAAIKALTAVIRGSDATTMMGLQIELKNASDALKACDKTSISLKAGCDLFIRYVTRTSVLDAEDISAGKARLIERGERFSEISLQARETIAALGQDFVHDGATILVHGKSRVVTMLLRLAATGGKHFNVVCTEGRADDRGIDVAAELAGAGIPVTLILDAGVGYMMERINMVLVGAEGVVESGGVINTLGTFQIAMVAKAMGRPVYVAAESYKFARLYPLDQRDIEPAPIAVQFYDKKVPASVHVENSARDYTPPHLLTLLFTDLGVLTPAAVSDELIKLYL